MEFDDLDDRALNGDFPAEAPETRDVYDPATGRVHGRTIGKYDIYAGMPWREVMMRMVARTAHLVERVRKLEQRVRELEAR